MKAKQPGRTKTSSPAARLALALSWLGRLHAAAENHVDYKYELYAEDSDRIVVHTHTALFEQQLTPSAALKGALVYDGISGATPTGGLPPAGGNQVPTARVDDVRRGADFEAAFKLGRHRIAPRLAYSSEEDYESTTVSLSHQIDLNKRNTTLIFSLAHSRDNVGGFHLGHHRKRKDATDLLLGITQVLSPTTLVNATLSLGTADGYLSDPYKGFRFTRYPDPNALFPEKRPGHRTKQIVSTTLTQFVEPVEGSAELTYRFYHDSHELIGHTITLEWFQSVGRHLIVAPLLRYYRQSEAAFYRRSFDADPSDTENPSAVPIPQFYSADYRLSALQSWTFGLGATVKIGQHLRIDAAYKRYEVRGLDHQTPQDSYARAHVLTAGLRLIF